MAENAHTSPECSFAAQDPLAPGKRGAVNFKKKEITEDICIIFVVGNKLDLRSLSPGTKPPFQFPSLLKCSLLWSPKVIIPVVKH